MPQDQQCYILLSTLLQVIHLSRDLFATSHGEKTEEEGYPSGRLSIPVINWSIQESHLRLIYEISLRTIHHRRYHDPGSLHFTDLEIATSRQKSVSMVHDPGTVGMTTDHQITHLPYLQKPIALRYILA